MAKQLVMARLDRLASNKARSHSLPPRSGGSQYEMLAAVVGMNRRFRPAHQAGGGGDSFRKGSRRVALTCSNMPSSRRRYTMLETAERRQFHQKVGEVMEARFQSWRTINRVAGAPFYGSALMEKALGYWLRAGRNRCQVCQREQSVTSGAA